MRTETCDFCSRRVFPGCGIQLIRNKCKVFKTCGPKCYAALKKKQDPCKAKWTKAYRGTVRNKLTSYPAFEVEKWTHMLEKYSTKRFSKVTEAIRQRRKTRAYIIPRLEQGKDLEEENGIKDAQSDLTLIISPPAGPNRAQPDEEMSEECNKDSENVQNCEKVTL